MISVIVPVYNVCGYLRDSAASILAQTVADLECILVDDGSTDGSGELCDEIARTDGRVCVIHKTNGGLSDARNAGIEVARGQYLAFVDSDDRLTPNALKSLLAKIRAESLDVAVGNVEVHDEQTGGHRLFAPLSTPRPRNLLDELFNVTVCNKLFRREVFATRRFPLGIKFEDVSLWAEILFSGVKIGYVDETVYIYNVNREGSIVTTRDYRDYPAAWESQREALRKHGKYDNRIAPDFIARITMKFIQALNLSSPPTRRAFYARARTFYLECGSMGVECERGKIVSTLLFVHARACRLLPYGLYRALFGWEAIISLPLVNRALKGMFQNGRSR